MAHVGAARHSTSLLGQVSRKSRTRSTRGTQKTYPARTHAQPTFPLAHCLPLPMHIITQTGKLPPTSPNTPKRQTPANPATGNRFLENDTTPILLRLHSQGTLVSPRPTPLCPTGPPQRSGNKRQRRYPPNPLPHTASPPRALSTSEPAFFQGTSPRVNPRHLNHCVPKHISSYPPTGRGTRTGYSPPRPLLRSFLLGECPRHGHNPGPRVPRQRTSA